MKKYINAIIFISFAALIIFLFSCDEDFLEKAPLGTSSEATMTTKAGVEGLLIGAYSMLDGYGNPRGGNPYGLAVSNWIYGGVASDDAHKGSTDNDVSQAADIMKYTTLPVNSYLNAKWISLYTGVQRANDVIRTMSEIKDGSISETQAQTIKAEAIFLRAVFHFEAVKLWRNVPYINETITYEASNFYVDNCCPIWPQLEDDFKFAIANLPTTQKEIGRANSWAAKAFLAKVYMFQQKYSDAKTLLDDIINNGVTSAGQKYGLVNFADNFNPSKNNSAETVFAVQMTVKDNGNGSNANAGDVLNFPYGGVTSCCGFYQPTFSLVNSYRTDPVTGLPLLDTWNDSDLKNDQGLASTQPFTPSTETLDPRLDWTVGRRGIPLLDWGIMPGKNWIRAQPQGGPYVSIKHLFYNANRSTTTELVQAVGNLQGTSNNYEMIRFADVILWAAECEVEIGSLNKAQTYVNMIRLRAADKNGWVKSDVAGGGSNYDGFAANYFIKLYPDGHFALYGKDYARKAVRFERKIELALEGHRFFDLQRYDNGTGYMADVLNSFIQHENRVANFPCPLLKGAVFTKGRNEVYPIPQTQIDLSVRGGAPTLTQNPGY